MLGPERKGPRKVEAKLFQGPIVHRTALGEVVNRPVLRGGLNNKAYDNIQKQTSKVIKPKVNSTSTATRIDGKENVGKVKKVPEENQKVPEEKMEVEEMAEVEELAVAFSVQHLDVDNVDAGDESNPQLVSEYVNDIYMHLRHLEVQNPVNPKYLEGQVITWKMRAILIDWLIQVHTRFTLMPETLYLTVAIIDRFIQVERNIPRNKLQLVGVTSMFIASKYEEMYCPEIADFAFMTDKACSKADIMKMEVVMLKKLKFHISYPLPLHFLRRNSKAGRVDSLQHTLAKYLMELCLPEYSMCHYKPSMIAGAALYLSLTLLDGLPWSPTLTFYSTYTEDKLIPVACKMAAILVKSTTSKQQASEE
ncbi:hypothetical protein Pmani_013036 [Petrolisthes manimaculis]|uniref:Cyclin B n=1 Tax=Petrolisthes manimaculis TaxID=1843537 RepID=A0AAE1PWS8_9EUCA|nr:hypothetical protein Pmani_013036 [Petrolisthes manimaculis]